MQGALKLIFGAIGAFLIATAGLAFTQNNTDMKVGLLILAVGIVCIAPMFVEKKKPGRAPVPPASTRR